MAEVEEDEVDNAPKGVNRKLVLIVQRYQKEQEKNFGKEGVSSLSEEILAQTFLTKF